MLVAREAERCRPLRGECRIRGAAERPRRDSRRRRRRSGCAGWSLATVARHGRLDAVVHSAGVVAYGRLEDVPAEVFDGVMRTNLLGSANVARHVLPVLRAATSRDTWS